MGRICFLLPDFRGGGAEKVALDIITHLVATGRQVDLVLLRQRGELLALLPADVRVFDLNATRIRNAFLPFWRYIRRERPQAIEASMWPITIVAIVANLLAGRPAKVVVSNHAILSLQFPSARTRAAIGWSTRLFYRFADARIAVSHAVQKDVTGLSGVPADSFTIVHNPIALPDRLGRHRGLENIWRGAGLRLLTVGTLKDVKRHDLLIRALARLPKSADARLVIGGSGELEQELKSLAEAEGVAERVTFMGFVQDPWPLYSSADVFALCSDHEAFGNVLVEALYAGLPVVSTSTGGACEVLDNGRYGILLEDASPEAIAAAIMKAAGDTSDPASRVERARDLSGPSSLRAYEALLSG